MAARSSTSSVLLLVLVIITFPLWIGIAGGLFGLMAGLFGAAIGLVAGVFGAIVGIFGGIFGWIFDWDFNTHWPSAFFGSSLFITMAIVLVVVLITRSRKV